MAKKTNFNICKRNPNEPQSYIQWHAWAEKMSETHSNEKCEYCGLFHVWVKRQDIKPTAATKGSE